MEDSGPKIKRAGRPGLTCQQVDDVLLTGHGRYSLDYLDHYAEQGSLRLHALPGDAGYPNLSCVECSVNIDFNLVEPAVP